MGEICRLRAQQFVLKNSRSFLIFLQEKFVCKGKKHYLCIVILNTIFLP